MAGWQRYFQSVLLRVGKIAEHNYTASANFSCSRVESFLLPGELPSLQGLWKSPSPNPSRPLYQYLQQLGISCSRKLLAGSSDETPIPSPLSSALALSSSGKTEGQMTVCKHSKVQAVLKGIKQSPKKINLVATLVRGMRVEDALLQLQVTVNRASKTDYQVIHSARANATHNHGLDSDSLLVAEAIVGKGFLKKRVS